MTKKNKPAIFLFIIIAFGINAIFFTPKTALALNNQTGEKIFFQHCAGCHIKGGNIIRRSKNLKLSALNRNGINAPEAISKIAREGIGIMNGYSDVLEKGEDEIVAIWILEQAQKAWTQG